ncbi:LytTR family transcriptional regulator DNA-binding domain-containing protein [Pedobacter sp. Leaf132]|uniref:LytTR family transcriptional regulator DNA-binding domain-containing protein n=1 Tax=Pedobacter sp. Leaf132 TaxID=2876557 RepID=UPI001E2BE243|nr:LytTR family transcriptional regulator DNA-binding domain-containing protein [Pedobacter sp. Leaf132]
MIVQIVCGFIISSMLAIFLAMIYFKLNGISIWNAGYFRYDFTVVLCFIALVNSFYVILSLFQLKLLPSRRNHSNARISSQEQIKKDIPAIIFSEQKHNFALQFDAHKFNWPKSLKATMGDLPLEDYFQINRGTIIHYNIISHYRPLTSDTLKLVLKAPFEDIYYVVSQRNAVDFKRWFDGGNDLTVNA